MDKKELEAMAETFVEPVLLGLAAMLRGEKKLTITRRHTDADGTFEGESVTIVEIK